MKIYILIITLIISTTNLFSQNDPSTSDVKSILVYDKTYEIKNSTIHVRANKGDILRINLLTEVKNKKKETHYKLGLFRVYREFATDEFQYIINKINVGEIKNMEINVPSDGIYTFYINRGKIKKFDTNLKIERIPEHDSLTVVKRVAIKVEMNDTIHTYPKDSVVYDHIRVSTPRIKKQETAPYYEDQIFMDEAFALRIGNVYSIPIVIPLEIVTQSKQEKSVSWGYYITVSNKIYSALKGKMSEVATAGMDKGVGSLMGGKIDNTTGAISKNKVQKGYEVFDKASTANAYAEISGDVAEQAEVEEVESESDVIATITGFTGLTDVAGGAIASFVTPKVEDKIRYKLMTEAEYIKYINKQAYTTIKKGTTTYTTANFKITDPNQIYYLVIKNDRDGKGDALDIIGDYASSIISQYVYASVKVFVQKETVVTYDKGYYENTYTKLYNYFWPHKQEIKKTQHIIFADEMKPYYKKLNATNIY